MQKSLTIAVGAMLLALTINSDAQNTKPNSAVVQKWLSEPEQKSIGGLTLVGSVTDGMRTTIYFRMGPRESDELRYTTCSQLDPSGWYCDPQKVTSGRIIRP